MRDYRNSSRVLPPLMRAAVDHLFHQKQLLGGVPATGVFRRRSENLAEVSGGKTTSRVLGVLAHLLNPS